MTLPDPITGGIETILIMCTIGIVWSEWKNRKRHNKRWHRPFLQIGFKANPPQEQR